MLDSTKYITANPRPPSPCSVGQYRPEWGRRATIKDYLQVERIEVMRNSKFEICPKCGKKGLHRYQSGLYAGNTCRYCNYQKATHRWRVGEKDKNGYHPNAGYVEVVRDSLTTERKDILATNAE